MTYQSGSSTCVAKPLWNTSVKASLFSKMSASYKTSSESEAGSLISASTSSSPAKQLCNPTPLNKEALTCQSQKYSENHQRTTSPPHEYTIPRACHAK